MSSIPYNYGKYIDDTVRLRDPRHSRRRQTDPPAVQVVEDWQRQHNPNDRTQMQMGN